MSVESEGRETGVKLRAEGLELRARRITTKARKHGGLTFKIVLVLFLVVVLSDDWFTTKHTKDTKGVRTGFARGSRE
jgi:hypothetical protein